MLKHAVALMVRIEILKQEVNSGSPKPKMTSTTLPQNHIILFTQ